MRPTEYVRFAAKSLWSRKLRSSLTIVGISIGIALYVVLLSQTQGLYDAIVGQIGRMGASSIYVISFRRDVSLSLVDVTNIYMIPGVVQVIPLVQGQATLSSGGNTMAVSVLGMDFADLEVAYPGLTTQDGEIPSTPGLFAALVGHRVAYPPNSNTTDPLVRSGDSVMLRVLVQSGTQITPVYRYLSVSAVLAQYGIAFGTSGIDGSVVIPLDVANFLFNKRGVYDAAIVIAQDVSMVSDISTAIQNVLGGRFSTISPGQIVQSAQSILGLVQVFLGAMAAVSLIVSGVGIANIMYISVMERVKIIGLYKALGMRKWDVAALYVVESGLIGLLGGLLGIAVGYLVSAYGLNLLSFGVSSTPVAPTGITQAAQAQMASLSSFSFSPTFSLELLVTALAIALLVSVVAGLYPAYRASQLEPAQALRAE
jgi:ABC-type antimicrobial peptide transport system permease subunit